jgi:hypothetical protein
MRQWDLQSLEIVADSRTRRGRAGLVAIFDPEEDHEIGAVGRRGCFLFWRRGRGRVAILTSAPDSAPRVSWPRFGSPRPATTKGALRWLT